MTPFNQFDHLYAECAESRYAQMTPEEHAELQAWMAEVDAKNDAQVQCADTCAGPDDVPEAPDAHLEAAYEERTHVEEEPYDGGGWPGDGSGTDDLADLMAHGDEGCCDGPED